MIDCCLLNVQRQISHAYSGREQVQQRPHKYRHKGRVGEPGQHKYRNKGRVGEPGQHKYRNKGWVKEPGQHKYRHKE